MEPLSLDQQTAHEQPHLNLVWFAEFSFASGVVRVSTLNINHTWGGFDWMGLGSVSDITPFDERQGVASESLTFTLSLARTDWLAIAVGAVEEYRGRSAKLYHCPMDANFRLVGTPKRCWTGTMSQMQADVTGAPPETQGSVSLLCETAANGLRRRNPLRLNAAQHKQKFPADTGFDRMTRLVGNQFPWLSVRFQRR